MNIDLSKLTALIAVPAALAGAFAGWNIVGWMTPDKHTHDLEIVQTTAQAQYEAVINTQRAFRDEWYCDEESEYLDELLLRKDAGDTSAYVEQEILEQRQKMADAECHRFDKD